MKKTISSPTWSEILGPTGGSVSCTAVIEGDDPVILIGSQIGVFCHNGLNLEDTAAWTRLKNAPVGVLSLAVACDGESRTIILAGTTDGVYGSQDLGLSWSSAKLPLSSSTILSLAVSPNFQEDHQALAGTLEDGIFLTNNGGRRWQSQSFGMLDASVFAIAFSPHFVHDGTVFIGTESGIYYSYNHALAWKAIPFPEEKAPVLSLAVSPEFNKNQLVFAGTETNGLLATNDLGETWRNIEIHSACVNDLHFTPAGVFFAATENGLSRSIDLGSTWTGELAQAGAMNLSSGPSINLAGFLENGAWWQYASPPGGASVSWQLLEGLNLRGFTSMVLSRHFREDHTAFLASPQEGIWRTLDGGTSWEDLTSSFPGDSINQPGLFPAFRQPEILVSSDNGLWLSQNSPDNWLAISIEPCTRFALSQDGKTIVAFFPGIGMRRLTLSGLELLGAISTAECQSSWQAIPGPWDKGGQMVALACQKDGTIHAALLEGIGETLSLWQGAPGEIEKVHSQPAGENPLVSIWLPPEAAPDRPWYASLGEKIWKFSSRRGGVNAELPLFPEDTIEPTVALTGSQIDGVIHLFACTGRGIYESIDDGSWKKQHDFGDDRAVDFALSADFPHDQTCYTLLLGGAISFGKLLI